MKSQGKKKASKVTLKTHRKHKMLPKVDERTYPHGDMTAQKPEDLINRD